MGNAESSHRLEDFKLLPYFGDPESEGNPNVPSQMMNTGYVIECESGELIGELALDAKHLNRLGWLHLKQFRSVGELDDLSEAIKFFAGAVSSTPDDDPDAAEWVSDLGIACNDRFIRLGEVADLEESVRHMARALELTPDGHPDKPHRHADLGVCYTDRYMRLGKLADLEKAIECDSRALELTPSSHPKMARRHADLGKSYTHRYQRMNELADLQKAAECFSRALELTPDGHPDMADRHASLGMSYNHRYNRLSELADLEKAIECHSRALALTPNDHPDMAKWHANLGVCFTDQFRRLGELSDLMKAIECHSRAVELTPEGHLDMPDRYAGLGVSYGERYQRLGKFEDLEKAIECSARALESTPDDHPDMSQRHASLGVSYSHRYKRLGKLADLEKSIECHSRAVALTPDDHPAMLPRLANLGMSYGDRYRRLGELADLEKAIGYHFRVLASTPDGHPAKSSRLASLGVSYGERYQRLGKFEDLEKAIDCFVRALKSTPDDHPAMSQRHANLGESYIDRYRHLGELPDLDKAIECHSRAVALTPKDHPAMSPRLDGLGVSYSDRYRRLGELADLVKATECGSRALALTPEGHPDMSNRLAALGVCYSLRYKDLRELADLEKAIEYDSHALALTPSDHSELSRRHSRLGVSYNHRYQLLGELVDLRKAVESNSRALELTPDSHPDMADRYANLGVSFTSLYMRLGELEFLEGAIKCDSYALALIPGGHPNLATLYFHHAFSLFQQYRHTSLPTYLHSSLASFRKATQLSNGAPQDRFKFALGWGALGSHYDTFRPIEAYQTAIELLPQFIWLGATVSQRYHHLSTVRNFAVTACRAAILSSEHLLALEWLEHARCVVWSQSLALRSPLDQLHASHPDLANRLQAVVNELRTFSFETQPLQPVLCDSITSEQAGQQHRRLANEYSNLLAQTRQLPGFESFLLPIKSNNLMRAAHSGPVIVLNCHQDQSDALIILPGHNHVRHLPLPAYTEDMARQACSELVASLRSKGLRQRGVKPWKPADHAESIENMLKVLWTAIVKPVLADLGYMDKPSKEPLPHITWCLTGSLSFLPLHAAGDYSQPGSRVFDYAVSSYTPTLSALLESTPSSLNLSSRVLAIGQATTPGHKPLPGTTEELAHIKTHAHNKVQYTQLIDDQATPTSVLDAMEHHDWVHLACHAHQNVYDPTKSGFYLHDGTLDLASINRRSFRNKGLAFLSACQTATGDEKLPDEAIHLASGMLMAGYPSVIATMWSVVDEDAPFVADKIYEQLMKDGKIGNGEAGRALHDAVARLRNKVGEKEFGRWVPYIHIGS